LVSNEGHFTQEDRADFPPYLPSLCSGVTETAQHALRGHALEADQDWFKAVTKEGNFSFEAEEVFPPSPPALQRVTETAHQTLPGHPLQGKQVWSKSVSNEGYFNLEASISSRIAAG
jgi:hypothetical protein